MALIDDMKVRLRVTTDAFDSEIDAIIKAAKADMVRVGVDPDYVDEEGPLVTEAIACLCKSRFGYDNTEAAKFEESYRQAVIDLMNSSHNVMAADDGS